MASSAAEVRRDADAVALPALNDRVVSLLSGGLDSLLAARMLVLQGLDVRAITFATDFGCGTGTGGGCGTDTRGLQLGFDIKFCHLGEAYNRMVRYPVHGYGKNANPCIDCRQFMLHAAWEYAQVCGASWLATGEVLGQRPFSQRREPLRQAAEALGLTGRILRPLSARLLPVTDMERAGIVDRERLGAIKGRSRKPQMALASELGIESYPTPGGGCLLTDGQYARKVRDLFQFLPPGTPGSTDVRLLQFGRNLRLGPALKLVIARDEGECHQLAAYARADDMLIVPGPHHTGPTGLAIGEATSDELARAIAIVAAYCKGERPFVFELHRGDAPVARHEVALPPTRESFRHLLL